jgi:hypothetical protein
MTVPLHAVDADCEDVRKAQVFRVLGEHGREHHLDCQGRRTLRSTVVSTGAVRDICRDNRRKA